MGKTGISSRRAERILAFQVLYGLHFTEVKDRRALERLFRETPKATTDEDGPNDAAEDEKPHDFAWTLVEGVWTHREQLDTLIRRFSRNWRVERIGRIELTLLRLAVFELAFGADVPPKVAINEALDLTARFGDAKAKRFINGVLDAAAKAVENGTLNEDAPAS